jgi:Uma2 family endonuclease
VTRSILERRDKFTRKTHLQNLGFLYTLLEVVDVTWQEIVENPSLAGLPFKIETNEFGQVVMSPTKYLHGIFQARLSRLLETHLPNGIVSNETAIETRKGVKVPDVAWSSYAFFELHREEFALSNATKICIEVILKSNTVREIATKRKLYFERGALEVWTCDLDGNVHFYDAQGELEHSLLASEFPKLVLLNTQS